MTAVVIRADARQLPLADVSVDLVITSPPYFALRSYRDGGDHYDGQIGSETTPAAFVQALLDCTREWLRVLKPTGSLWVNLGDKYAGGGGGPDRKRDRTPFASTVPNLRGQTWGAPQKSLLGIPWRYALACIEQLGLVLRAEVIWSKPNALPESVTDRVRRDHEQWFHFTPQGRYFAAVDELREPFRSGTTWIGRTQQERVNDDRRDGGKACVTANTLGRLPGSVWTVASEPLNVPESVGLDHFAAFPLEFPRRIITGWSPSGICVECGEARRPVVERTEGSIDDALRELEWQRAKQRYDGIWNPTRTSTLKQTDRVQRSVTGYACGCDPKVCRECGMPGTPFCEGFRCCAACTHNTLPPTRPAVVLDPFGGTGTTALAASVLGRLGVSVDLSSDYCRLARWRTTDPGERARAMRVEKPPKQMDGQLDLLGEAS